MQLVPPELSDLLAGALIPRVNGTSPNDMLSGIAGLSSIAGGFDDAILDGVVGAIEPLDYPDYIFEPMFDDGNFSTIPALSTPGTSPVDPFIAMTYDRLNCGHFTVMNKKLHFTSDVTDTCRFWTEGVFSIIVAAFGLMGNVVSIWVLSVPEMRNSFNRLLLALAIIDCLFILPGILIYTSKAFAWKAAWYNYAFPVFLYPFSEIALCSSIYMTVAIAVERYIGLCLPLRRLSRRPCSARAYIIPVVIIALLLNVPKFLESETVEFQVGIFSNVTKTKVRVTDLRTNPTYITYYWMWTRLLATGILPLVVLAILNSKIYLSIRQSKQQLRILAIRSALPMAILSKNAPSVPVSDYVSRRGVGATSPRQGSSPEEADGLSRASPDPRRRGRGLGDSDGPEGLARANLPRQGSESGSPTLGRGSTRSKINGSSLHRIVIQKKSEEEAETPEDEVFNQNGQATTRNLPLGHRGAKLGRMVNGQLRQMQRSVSAFASGEPSTAFRKTLRLGRENQAPMLRSNSAAVTTSASALSRSREVNGHASAFEAQLLASTSNLASTGGGNATSSGGANGNDIKLAPILFGVVIVFILCNSLRVILNIYDFSVVDSIIACEKKGVGRLPPAWILCSISVSHLLLMANSSVNFLVYCVAGTRFRRVLVRKVRDTVGKLSKILSSRSKESQFQSSAKGVLASSAANRMQNNATRHGLGEARGLLQHDQRRNTTTTLVFSANPCSHSFLDHDVIASGSENTHTAGRHIIVSGRPSSCLRNDLLLEESESEPSHDNLEEGLLEDPSHPTSTTEEPSLGCEEARLVPSPLTKEENKLNKSTPSTSPPFSLGLENGKETSI